MTEDRRIKTTEESSFQKTANILLPFLIYFAVHDLAQILLAFLANLSLGALGGAYAEFMMKNAATVNGLLNALALLAGMAAVFPMARRELEWAKVWLRGEEPEAEKAGKTVKYLLLAVFAIAFALGMNMLMELAGLTQTSESYQEVAQRQFGVTLGMGILIYGVISPLAEETVFRGLIYNRMRRYFKRNLSVVVCGIMFGIYHGNLVQGIYGCILGIAITYSYEWFGSFFAPVLFHSLANIAAFLAGYDRAIKANIVTPLNCALLFAVSGAAAYAIHRFMKRDGV